MGDSDIRELEEDARHGGGPERLRWARSLERSGRMREAWFALLGGREHEDVRRELARRPAWGHDAASPGRSRWADVAPVRERPRVLWRFSPADESTSADNYLFAASPLGIAGCSHPSLALVVLDPESGAVRWTVPRSPRWWPGFTISGEVLWVQNELDLCRYDIWSGELLERVVLDGHSVHGGVVARRVDLDWHRPYKDGREETGWPAIVVRGERFACWGRGGMHGPADAIYGAVAGPNLVLAESELVAIFLATGAERWRSPGGFLRADDDLVVTAVGRDALLAVGSDGVERWRRAEGLVPALLSPAAVVAWPWGESRIAVLDRATGEVRTLLQSDGDGQPPYSFAGAREVIYFVRGIGEGRSLCAVEEDGRELWRISLEELGLKSVISLAALPWRLYARGEDGSVVALG